jgi:polyhydroxyalkanoate synthase
MTKAKQAEKPDRWSNVQMSTITRGNSTATLRAAFSDWLAHLSQNPAAQAALMLSALKATQQLAQLIPHAATSTCNPCIAPLLNDRRFSHPGWQSWPFSVWSQSFLLTQQWWHEATTGVRGVAQHHEDVVSFTLRQLLDLASPANFAGSNPEVLEKLFQTGGASLMQGLLNYTEDTQRSQAKLAPAGVDAFEVGKNIAVTPGKVIYRNDLIELIQYEARGDKTWPKPILIVPSWIMKYYILDLSPANSLINYLVNAGHTVFSISWNNPESEGRNLGMDDYLQLGIMEAINTIANFNPNKKIHTVGYCLGGTLLTISAAAMGRDGDDRLASVSLLAAQTDFTEPGELSMFIDESQIAYLEDFMWDKGYLSSNQMVGAFQLMRSTDLIWSRILNEYLLGERAVVTDLMAWSADGTRLPYRMHSQYLRRMFLNNDLASGRYVVGDQPVLLSDISVPIYCVGTAIDHVAPWRSVYKLNLLTDAEVTFVLASEGHHDGIVNPPGVAGRSYQVLTKHHADPYLSADHWLQAAPLHEGSWWTNWADWLQVRSGKKGSAPLMGEPVLGVTPLCDAPGMYVLKK